MFLGNNTVDSSADTRSGWRVCAVSSYGWMDDFIHPWGNLICHSSHTAKTMSKSEKTYRNARIQKTHSPETVQ